MYGSRARTDVADPPSRNTRKLPPMPSRHLNVQITNEEKIKQKATVT